MMLITPSLLNSFDYYLTLEAETTEDDEGNITTAETKEDAARTDFIRTLSRVKTPPTPAMQNGIDFENRVHACCQGQDDDSNAVRELAAICRGGVWQQPVKAVFGDFLLYGKTDVIKRDTIYDIKFTGSYEVGKFLSNMQHRIYLYCTGMPKFAYLVSNGRDWWEEAYSFHAGLEDEIENAITKLLDYLKGDAEASKLFFDNWKSL